MIRALQVATVAMTFPVLLATGCGMLPWSDDDTPASATVTVVRGLLEIDVPAKGELEALNASPVAVPRVPTGALKVSQVVDEGTIVDEGAVVVVFDDTQLNIELDNHRATFRSADRRIDGTQLQSGIETGGIAVMREVAELERDNVAAFEIIDESIYSRQEILQDEVRLEEAEETIVFADASLLLRGEYYDIEERILDVEKRQVGGKIERVEFSLGNLVLKAPLGGMIVYKKNWRGGSVAVGDTLWPGNVIMSIVDPAKTALRAYVLERDAAGLAVGAEATVRIDARSDREFLGKVTTVAEISRPIERGSPVKYSEVKIEIVDGDPSILKPGMKGEASIRTYAMDEAVIIPRSAVMGDAEDPFVLISRAGGTERRPVKLGPGGLVRVSVEEGLEGGEEILIGAPEGEAPDAPDVQTTEIARAGGS